VLIAIVLYLVLPTAIVAIVSFSSDTFIEFPPRTYGLRQYSTLLEGSTWLDPFLRSLVIASIVCVASTVIGLAAVLGIHRTSVPGRNLLPMFGIAPLLAPGIAYAVALYSLFAWLKLLDTPEALILAHTTIAVPFSLLIIGSAITRVPRELELAALSLGASRMQAWRDVTLRMLLPAIGASLIFSFIASFDEPVLASFLSPVGFVTLPVAIFNSVRFSVDPVITAIATLLAVGTGLLLGLYALLRRAR
jgi:ABC-type spermidine/putrescine transport system permease subunit II